MAKVPEELILKRAPAICKCVIFGKGCWWCKSKQEVWPTCFQRKLICVLKDFMEKQTTALCASRAGHATRGALAEASLGGLLDAKTWKKELEISVNWEQWVLFHLFIAFPKVCGY